MTNLNKPLLALIATITILAGGGALYLKIKPGPGKQATVTNQGRSVQNESLTPAEEAVKRGVEETHFKTPFSAIR